jgi:CheY-like chemotaxis protein
MKHNEKKQEPPPSSGRRVLVIDDEPEMIKLIRLILSTRCGDEVINAVGGHEGIATAQANIPLDLIIIDIMMPKLDGYQAYPRIKSIPGLEQVPILFIAAMSADAVYPEAQRIGAAGYLVEPFSPDDLQKARDAALKGETYYPPLNEKGWPRR